MSVSLWFLVIPQLVSSSPTYATHPTHSCPEAVDRQLTAWRATDEVLRAPSGPLGGAVYRIATTELGVWITLHQPRGLQTVSLFRTSPEGTVRVDFGAQCEPAPPSSFSSPSLAENAFTDADVRARLAADDRLVVYLWSPHLPLSVEGFHEIAHAAARLGVPLVAVVDGSADAALVTSVADDNEIPADARRPLGSVELLFRDLAVHTPSVIVFASGRVSAPLPGYRGRDAYRIHLETVFRK